LPTKSAKTEYHYIGHYAGTLEGGRPVEPSEIVELTKEEVEANKVMIEEGFLVKMVNEEGGESK
jgi:hypothetical protein